MKKFKRYIALTASVVMAVAAMSVTAFAGTWHDYDKYAPSWGGHLYDDGRIMSVILPNGEQISIPTWEEAYAYLDYENAPNAQLKENILQARAAIVYGPDARWCIDGQVSIMDDDGNKISLPEFSDVFPADWDLNLISQEYDKIIAAYNDGTVKAGESTASAKASGIGFKGMVAVPKSSSSMANDFYRFTGNGSSVVAYAATLPTNYTINIGFKNLDTNKDAGWIGNLKVNGKIGLNTVSGVRYSTRCSSYSGNCQAYMVVEEA